MKDIFIAEHILAEQIKFITGLNTVIINNIPATFDRDIIYIVVPKNGGVRMTPQISSDTFVEFSVDILQIAHEASMNRQKVIVDDVHNAMMCGNTILEECIPRINNLNLYNGATIKEMETGTTTWVTDTKIYTMFRITLNLSMYISY